MQLKQQGIVTTTERITVWQVSSLSVLDLTNDENTLFVGSEDVEANLVKLVTICTVILPLLPRSMALWLCDRKERRK